MSSGAGKKPVKAKSTGKVVKKSTTLPKASVTKKSDSIKKKPTPKKGAASSSTSAVEKSAEPVVLILACVRFSRPGVFKQQELSLKISFSVQAADFVRK